MVEHESFTVSVKKTAINPSTTALSLITQERNQKLELLIHLLTNLSQALVVCGPQGIGKSTLLHVLQARENQFWLYCSVPGHPGLSFEAIQEQLGKMMGLDKSQSLLSALSRYDEQHKKIVLIIDDAGFLVPGLITTIIQYAAAHPVLRVVFVLTHDELHVRSKSDQVLDDCHVIEIPPLSEKQCGEFLQVLASQARVPASNNGITEHLIETVYRETHGIPGKIIESTPQLLSHQKEATQGKWGMAVAVAALVAIAVAVQFSSSTNKDSKEMPVADSKVLAPEVTPPVASTPLAMPVKPVPVLEPSLPATEEEPLAFEIMTPTEPMVTVTIEPEHADVIKSLPALAAPVPVAKKIVELGKVSAEQATPVAKKTAEDIVVSQEKKPELESPLSQSGNYTLQLMVLSKQASIDDIQRKYPALKSNFRVVKTIVGGQERFVLMYGSFDSAASANKARQSLPPEFRNALARKAGAR